MPIRRNMGSIPGNIGVPGGRMPAQPGMPMLGPPNTPRPGMPGPQSGAIGGAMGGQPPAPPPPAQPFAGGPTSPMNIEGSGMLQAQGPAPASPNPLPPWGSMPSSTGTEDMGAGTGMGMDGDMADLMNDQHTAANPNASQSMSPLVMLRLLKATGKI